MLYLHWILFFLKDFLDYEKINIWIQTLKRHKLTRHSDVFRSKIDLRVAS